MYNVRKVTESVYWIGGSDRRLALFENIFPIQRGVSYNAYVVLDEKTVLLDTQLQFITRLKIPKVKFLKTTETIQTEELV